MTTLNTVFKVWKLQKFALTLFWQKFRESTAFTRRINKELIWRKHLVRVIFLFSTLWYILCTVWYIVPCRKFRLLPRFWRKNCVKLTVLLLVDLTKKILHGMNFSFLQKTVLCNYTVQCTKYAHFFEINFVKATQRFYKRSY